MAIDVKVKFNVFHALGTLEAMKGRRYSYNDIAEHSGLSRQTIRNVLSATPSQINVGTLAGLLKFFANEGMQIGVEELFDIQIIEEQ